MKAEITKIRKWIYMLLGLFLLGFPTSVWAKAAPVENMVKLEVKYGFGNNVKSNSAVPVKVEVICESGAVSGKIQIEIPVESGGNLNASIWLSDINGKNNKEQRYIWEKEICLVAGESVKEDFCVELPMNESYFNVKVISDHQVLASEQILCDYMENNARLLVGVVSENRAEIAQINGMQIGKTTYYNNEAFLKAIPLVPEDIYDFPWALEQLDILIVDKGVEFSNEQKMAIDIWQNNGGLYYERETESLLDVITYFQMGEYAEQFQSILKGIGDEPSYKEDFDRIPLKDKIPIGRYIFSSLLYLLIMGPGIYWFLRERHTPYWLVGSVCMISCLFIFLIYLTGRSINMGTPAICHRTLLEQDGNYLKETIDFSVQAYQMQNFELVLDKNYQILPKAIGMNGEKSVDTQMAESVTFGTDGQKNTMLLENMSAYRQNCFVMEKFEVLPKDERITFEISGDGDSLQVNWNNPTQYLLRQAVIVLKNRIAVLGEIEPYTHGSLENVKLYSFSNKAISVLLNDVLDFSDYAFPEYEIENLTNVIWEKIYGTNQKEEKTFVIGILENGSNVFVDNTGFQVYGTSLMKIDVEIDWSKNGVSWCPNVEIYGTAYKGEYVTGMNLLDTKEAIVDYTISQMGELLSLEFFNVDYNRQENYVLFDGKIYVFNWKTGMFTELLFWDEHQYNSLLEPYISNTGILRVYYVMDEWLIDSNKSCVLPCIKASGKVG